MRRLQTLIYAGLFALTGCVEQKQIDTKDLKIEQLEKSESEYLTIKGSAYSERYMPATCDKESRYSFAIYFQKKEDVFVKLEKKAVEVKPTKEISLESVDALINPEHSNTIEFEVKRTEKDKQHYILDADKIKVE